MIIMCVIVGDKTVDILNLNFYTLILSHMDMDLTIYYIM